jgi:lipopolysaccharide export system permease protein
MLNLAQLENAIDTYKVELQRKKDDYYEIIRNRTLPPEIDSAAIASSLNNNDSVLWAKYSRFKASHQLNILETAISQIRSNSTYAQGKGDVFLSNEKSINRHLIEWHRKLTLSIACILLFFIGAPLGAIIRKGGLGLPVVISVLFFLAYHITSITFEKLAKQGEMDAGLGMWISSMALFPIGLFLTYQATTDSKVLDMETYTKAIEQLLIALKLKEDTNPKTGKV